ncbi:MAG: 4-vinyl reductase [Candidatus Aenigmatarchaeota archaeon]
MGVKEKLTSFWKSLEGASLFRKYVNGEIGIKEVVTVEKGGIKFFGIIPVFPMEAKDWGRLIEELIKIHGPGVVATMRMSYKKNGYEETKELKKILPKEKIIKLLEFWIDLGHIEKILEIKVGKNNELREVSFENILNEIKEEDNKVVVKVKGSLSCKAVKEVMKKTRYPVCIHEPGYIAGFLEALVGGKWEVEETKCEGMGDKFCEWVFFKK